MRFDHLKSYKEEPWNGGLVQFIRPHVIHLMRGFTYTIEKQRFWVMGGAISIDITDGLFDKEDPLLKEKILDLKKQGKNYYRIRGINWFPEEMPSEEEQERGMESLRKKWGWRQIISLHMRRLPWCQIIFQLGDLRQMN